MADKYATGTAPFADASNADRDYVNPQDVGASLLMFDSEYAGTVAENESIALAKLPVGAKIIQFVVYPIGGTGGVTLDLGDADDKDRFTAGVIKGGYKIAYAAINNNVIRKTATDNGMVLGTVKGGNLTGNDARVRVVGYYVNVA